MNNSKNGDSISQARRKSPPLTSVSVLFPTPSASDGRRGPDFARAGREGSGGNDLITAVAYAEIAGTYGEYEEAVRRWEGITREAPAPTEPNKFGKPRLTVEFDEWMMGLPEGWISDADIPYRAKLKLCGNGVVPQQAELALRQLLET